MGFAEEVTKEWRKAAARLSRRFTAVSSISEDEIEKLLVEQGVISANTPPSGERAPVCAFEPIDVTGKPISEMIVEERK